MCRKQWPEYGSEYCFEFPSLTDILSIHFIWSNYDFYFSNYMEKGEAAKQTTSKRETSPDIKC
jgi:hypothetical protein